ncbi:calcium-binding and coiled-coil domain-containing protein 2 isoform X1 [Cyprinodon tularosa]|uniref:calcium-binding and coiled-coil domain-containing protein 2 isoform X1 n=1 Tax=Cyprinodon tularosa TaxID=77115 RepID=UPI0018E24B02|nr:calcium-binding and coiled-coil domain-containing protein 2 isoform X1 [Cyprinodon tularosa]XP_038139428.1 calcium-binding and coiled-coil domain-containing protein 2 isoform X1 [Cyprinodon tularosa]
MEPLPDAAAAATDPPAPNFSQVVFIDIPHSYPPSSPITCRFTLSTAFQAHPRDWVGIFKVGWSSTKDYHTFVWVEAVHDPRQTETRQAVFKEYYLPKDEIEFYQFCYIDNSGQVRGASTPFCFRNPSEQNAESIEEDDLLVITTQDQVEKSRQEKAELQEQLEQMRAENEALKSALQKDMGSFKEQNAQREEEKAKLVKDMDQVKEQNEKLKQTLQMQMKENDRLKEEMMIQMTKELDIQRQNSTKQEKSSLSLRSNEERYDRAVMKINQMKEEREELKGKIVAQSDEITKLKANLREKERELSKTTDYIQLLQVDLQSTNKENELLSAEQQKLLGLKGSMDELKRENLELRTKLSQLDSLQNAPQDELRVQCQTLTRELQEALTKLVTEREETRAIKRRAELSESELQDVKEQLSGLAQSCDMEQCQKSKYEMQVMEMNELLADRNIAIQDKEQEILLIKQERDELIRENQGLKGDVERLRALYTNSPTTAEEPSYVEPELLVPGGDGLPGQDQQHRPDRPDNIYETIDSMQVAQEEQVMVCRHCQESFPGITQQELEQHEQSHRVCPFCTMICDTMEQSVFEDHVYSHEL